MAYHPLESIASRLAPAKIKPAGASLLAEQSPGNNLLLVT
ncbi:hypothetical protein EMIT0194MI4_20329 [Pseudomonas sp. IT-194MI4]